MLEKDRELGANNKSDKESMRKDKYKEIKRIKGKGVNSCAYMAKTSDGEIVFIKKYPDNGINRIQREVYFLENISSSFLKGEIPELKDWSLAEGWIETSWISGSEVKNISKRVVVDFADFIMRINHNEDVRQEYKYIAKDAYIHGFTPIEDAVARINQIEEYSRKQ